MSERKNFLSRIFESSWILAGLATLAFYAVMHQPAMRHNILHRYTCEHPVEYVIVVLFMWGIVEVVLKLLSFPPEMLALRHDWLPPRRGRESIAQAAVLLERVESKPRRLRDSRIGRRLVDALEYVKEKGSAEEYREHLQYLADQDQDAMHGSYTLIRFVVGVTPVLGFLGTVVHFGTALSGISFDQMANRLPTVVSEMGEAFNTTTTALAAAMSMMFSLFLCERADRRMLRATDRYVERELLNRFEIKSANFGPFLSAVQSAADETLKAIAGTLQRQIEVWAKAFDALFQRFDARQQQELHAWQAALEVLERRQEAFDAGREERLGKWLAAVESKQDKHLELIHSWLSKVGGLKDEFAGFAKTLERIARGEGKLAELQAILIDNLRALHEAHQLDEALHGLSAAIHLLTAKQRSLTTFDAAA